MSDNSPRFGTIAAACKVIGGDKPVSSSTYYRGVALAEFTRLRSALPQTSAELISTSSLSKLRTLTGDSETA